VEDIFKGVKTLAGANRRYRALAMKWHPDTCRDTDAHDRMAELNRQYKAFVREIDSNTNAHQGNRKHAKVASKAPNLPLEASECLETEGDPILDSGDFDRLIDKGVDLVLDFLGSIVKRGSVRLKRTMNRS
jgi:hypothetical protein